MRKKSPKTVGFWLALSFSTFTLGCTSQEGFKTVPAKQQISQAAVNFMDLGRWRPISTSNRTRTHSYIATEGFYIPNDATDSFILEKEVQNFLQSYKVNTQDTIILDGLRDGSGTKTPTAINAINSLKFTLTELGYQSSIAKKPIAIFIEGTHNAAILIHRKIIVPPECSVKKHPKGTRPAKRTLGCAQEVNLANMVVSPDALDGTQPITSADSTAVSLGIERYRKGEITPLISGLSTSGISE
ncbi:CpaD family pilus assembly lipoprotein [Kiloniella litopenaei]|uniref:CpaD family pilus assembly lipoprotein n=1 Tax=Kiloniella litopenaei TaxID=1549748 RepID=UPI003BAADC32